MPRTRSMDKENQTPAQMENLLTELMTKAKNVERAAEINVQKRKIPKMRVPYVRLKKAHERILAPAPDQIPTPWDIFRAQIESGEGRARLRPVIIVIDDD